LIATGKEPNNHKKGEGMKKVFIIISILMIVLLIGLGFFLVSMSNYGPKFEDVKNLTAPRIITKPNIKAIVVEAIGDPNQTVGPAFSLLFKTFYKIKKRPKSNIEAPRARWPKPLTTPKNEWVGAYAMPVPPAITSLPDVKSKSGLHVELREWKYGEVAEILHVGPYGKEVPTVEKLKAFIAQNGYEICGDHEEEYLKGPGFLPTNPEKYLTIIRYQVKKTSKEAK
jgi:hypothetical protein